MTPLSDGQPTSDSGDKDLRLILASASSARRRLLRSAGIDPIIRPAHVDEERLTSVLLAENRSSQDIVLTLASAKALEIEKDLIDKEPELKNSTVIIACDSMLSFGDDLQGKPHTPAKARERWAKLRENTAYLITGHYLIYQDQQIGKTSSTAVTFTDIDPEELEAYIASGEPLEVAGGFTLDAKGSWFIERIEGDPSSVIGLSLPLLRQLLHQVGLSPVDFWNQ